MKQENYYKKEYLLEILRSGLENDSIDDVEIIREVNNNKKGQHYLSNLKNISLEYTYSTLNNNSGNKIKNIVHLFIKQELSDETHKHMFRMDVFEIESKILKCVLPQIEQIVGIKIGPKFFYESKEHSEIFMEDLSKFGFKTKNRILGFTKNHMLMAIETLAKYHAGSIALDEKQPGSLHQYRQSLLGEYTHPNFLNMIKYCLEYLGNVMHNWSDEKCRKIAPKIEKLSKSVIENLKDNINYAKDEFCVLNHGDCWISNIMFLENDLNEPLEVRLVDYQVPVWTSPALDLQYFLSICPEFNIKYIFDDFFIEKYLHTLKETMEKIGCKRKPPTFDELKSSMMKRRSLALAGGLVFYPKIIVDPDDIGTIKNVLDNQAWNTKIYDNPKIIDKLVKLIPLIDTQGYFD